MQLDAKLCITLLKPASEDALYAAPCAHAVCSASCGGRIWRPHPTTTLRAAADAATTTRDVLLQPNTESATSKSLHSPW